MKKCTKCNIEKELSDFSKNKSSKDGLRPSCKSCVKEYYKSNADTIKEYNKEHYKANADKKNKQSKKYYKSNADKIKECKKKYHKANANKIKEYKKEYQKENADKIKEWQKEYRKANADKIKEYQKKYQKENADKINKCKKEYQKANADKINKHTKKRRKTDPLFKLTGSIRNLIRGSFKRGIKNLAKSKRTEEILGCSIPFFCNYIKGQFKKGMTLENHGEWHLDHIKPVSVATTEEEVIELNHYTNFQPLWAVDNLSKSNKLVEKQLKFL